MAVMSGFMSSAGIQCWRTWRVCCPTNGTSSIPLPFPVVVYPFPLLFIASVCSQHFIWTTSKGSLQTMAGNSGILDLVVKSKVCVSFRYLSWFPIPLWILHVESTFAMSSTHLWSSIAGLGPSPSVSSLLQLASLHMWAMSASCHLR